MDKSDYSAGEIIGQVSSKLAFLTNMLRDKQDEFVLNDDGREGLYWICSDMRDQLDLVGKRSDDAQSQ